MCHANTTRTHNYISQLIYLVTCKWSNKIRTKSSFLLNKAKCKHFQAKLSSEANLSKHPANLTSQSSGKNPKCKSRRNIKVSKSLSASRGIITIFYTEKSICVLFSTNENEWKNTQINFSSENFSIEDFFYTDVRQNKRDLARIFLHQVEKKSY